MKSYYYKLLSILLFCALLVSCGTKKQATASSVGSDITQDTAKPAETKQKEETCVTAKLGLTLLTNDKSISLGGTLRMKRDNVIQLSLVTFGIFEVARVEMTPEYFMLIDKMGKQYVKASYDDVSFLKEANIDFRTLQTYFWDEQTSSHAAWERKDFVKLGGRTLPTKHIITIPRGNKSVKATISLSNLKNDSGWETRTQVPTHYTEVSVNKLLSRIMNMTL